MSISVSPLVLEECSSSIFITSAPSFLEAISKVLLVLVLGSKNRFAIGVERNVVFYCILKLSCLFEERWKSDVAGV